MQHMIYDIETYPNVFTCSILSHETGYRWLYEVSDQRNDMSDMMQWLRWAQSQTELRMVGFNNEGFDYPVLHYIMQAGGSLSVADIYAKVQTIINTPWNDRFRNVVWDRDRFIPQLDLFKIHHFDNVAKSTSLKMLEFQMRRDTIQELPYAPGTCLEPHEIGVLRRYNDKDVDDTHAFFIKSLPAINFRDELSVKYGKDMTNFNDTKIGKSYFAMRLEQDAPGCTKNQTPRTSIKIADIIFPCVKFERDEFNTVLMWLKNQVITETKGVFDHLSATLNGFKYDFGTGGIHGCMDQGYAESNNTRVIVDVDVTSYYPSIAIENRLHPAHLGQKFCDIYADIKAERMKHKKGTPENAMLKLALNGVYGDSNNRFSPFYDPQYTMGVTINGQLLLCMLAEQLIKIPNLQMIQINTDGLTVSINRQHVNHLNLVCKWWEEITGLDLEFAEYSRIWIRDVNNYIAESATGKLKSKGAYMHKGRGWHQNQSALIVPMAVEAYLVHGTPVNDFIYDHKDPFNFCLRTKINRSSRLVWGDDEQQRVSRYFISRYDTGTLTKIMPPTAGQVLKNSDAPDRRMAVQKGWHVVICNDMQAFDWQSLNYDYYIEKAWELIVPVEKGVSP